MYIPEALKGGMKMNVNNKIYKLMEARGWTTYELAEKAGLTQSTVSNLFRASAIPTIPTLEKICSAFGITLSDFFEEDSQSKETMMLVHKINRLTENRKNLTKAIIDEFQDK